ncbi:MAG: Do family serine endopeptidase [Fibrobacterota bacterium]
MKSITAGMRFQSVLLIMTTLLVFSCSAQEERPEKGSISFGASRSPKIEGIEQFKQMHSVSAEVADAVLPTVVSITSTKIDTVLYRNPYNDELFRYFFGGPRGNGSSPRGGIQKREQRKSGIGSGVIVSDSGYILTNSHVIKGADEITVRLYDEREYSAEIIGIDSLTDVGVIRISDDFEELPVAALGNSDSLRAGDWVMAAGNPFNLNSTVTTGIVSALGRRAGRGSMYQNFIQTDAAINPGNSGGALVNMHGELIGINTMIYTRSGGYMGIGFAIPVNMARYIMEQLVYEDEVSRGWIGVSIGELDYNMMQAFNIDKKGVLINDVFKGQPADKAGIESGDIIISIDGKRTENPNDLRNAVASIRPGKEVTLRVIRDGKERKLSITVADKEKAADGEYESSAGAADKGALLDRKMGISVSKTDQGVVIESVDPSSVAARAGLSEGDVIKEIKTARGFAELTSIDELTKYVKNYNEGDVMLLRILRGGRPFYAAVKF